MPELLPLLARPRCNLAVLCVLPGISGLLPTVLSRVGEGQIRFGYRLLPAVLLWDRRLTEPGGDHTRWDLCNAPGRRSLLLGPYRTLCHEHLAMVQEEDPFPWTHHERHTHDLVHGRDGEPERVGDLSRLVPLVFCLDSRF